VERPTARSTSVAISCSADWALSARSRRSSVFRQTVGQGDALESGQWAVAGLDEDVDRRGSAGPLAGGVAVVVVDRAVAGEEADP